MRWITRGLLLLNVAVLASCEPCLTIIEPANGAKVSMRPLVRGNVCDKVVIVSVIVHPVETDDYWVQPPVTVEKGGSWHFRPYIGRGTPVDSGKAFEIRAVAGHKLDLKEAQRLSGWPGKEAGAEEQSTIVNVTRE